MNIQQVKKNKKGFTIIELVIVIAVIAILAAVLIPTFTTVVNKSHESNALSRAKAAYTEILASNPGGAPSEFSGAGIQVQENSKYYVFAITSGQLATSATKSDSSSAKASNKTTDNKYSVPSGMTDVKIINS